GRRPHPAARLRAGRDRVGANPPHPHVRIARGPLRVPLDRGARRGLSATGQKPTSRPERARYSRERPRLATGTEPEGPGMWLSAIIPTLNEARYLPAAVEQVRLRAALGPPHEVIVRLRLDRRHGRAGGPPGHAPRPEAALARQLGHGLQPRGGPGE